MSGVGAIPSAEAQASLPHLPVRVPHILLGTISLRMFFWFIIVTRIIALKNNIASISILVPSTALKLSVWVFSFLPLNHLMMWLL